MGCTEMDDDTEDAVLPLPYLHPEGVPDIETFRLIWSVLSFGRTENCLRRLEGYVHAGSLLGLFRQGDDLPVHFDHVALDRDRLRRAHDRARQGHYGDRSKSERASKYFSGHSLRVVSSYR